MEQTLQTVHQQTQSKAINLSVFRDAVMGFLMSLIVGIASACILAVLVMLLSLPANAAEQPIDYDTISQGTLYLDLQGPEEYEESYNFCFRSVDAEFEMVKEAYEEFDPETLAQMRFVEIYIEEDGFVLEDD